MRIFINCLVLISFLITLQSCQQTIAENSNKLLSTEQKQPSQKEIQIINKYELPEELNEISGMVWLSENKFACVQDEEGIIYIYDIELAKILNRIKFGDNGDYEGLTFNGSTAYVQRSDGTIFIISNFLEEKPTVKEYKTSLTSKQNIEGIAYDSENNRLLSVVKDKEPGKVDYKGVYAFSLNSFKMEEKPVFKLHAKDNRYKKAGLKKNTFYPSGISIYKPTGHYFIVDGKQAGLLEMDKKGNILNVFDLGTKNFSQAESITFDDKGNIFISSEAGKDKAHISQIKNF